MHSKLFVSLLNYLRSSTRSIRKCKLTIWRNREPWQLIEVLCTRIFHTIVWVLFFISHFQGISLYFLYSSLHPSFFLFFFFWSFFFLALSLSLLFFFLSPFALFFITIFYLSSVTYYKYIVHPCMFISLIVVLMKQLWMFTIFFVSTFECNNKVNKITKKIESFSLSFFLSLLENYLLNTAKA